MPVIVCARLSRATETKGKSHRPGLADLRESGSIEQDADIVLFLYREDYYSLQDDDPEAERDEHKAECIVAKTGMARQNNRTVLGRPVHPVYRGMCFMMKDKVILAIEKFIMTNKGDNITVALQVALIRLRRFLC